jgi:hypothetical protein
MLDAAIARSRKEDTVLPQIIAQLMAHGVAPPPTAGAPPAAAKADGEKGRSAAEPAQPAEAQPADAEAGVDDKF